MPKTKPLLLVYTEHPMCSLDCADAVCDVLNSTGKYNARLIGPTSFPFDILGSQNLKKADCLVMPGGWGDSDQFDSSLLRTHSTIVRKYVASGGKYLGVCMGAYFAGHHYFNILAGDTKAAQYVRRKKSTVKHEKHDVVELNWEGEDKTVYFHDGAAFVPRKGFDEISGEIVATYTNGDAAALIQPYSKGYVGVMGPHPEAPKWWFYSQTRIKKRWRDCVHQGLFLSFTKKLLSL